MSANKVPKMLTLAPLQRWISRDYALRVVKLADSEETHVPLGITLGLATSVPVIPKRFRLSTKSLPLRRQPHSVPTTKRRTSRPLL